LILFYKSKGALQDELQRATLCFLGNCA